MKFTIEFENKGPKLTGFFSQCESTQRSDMWRQSYSLVIFFIDFEIEWLFKIPEEWEQVWNKDSPGRKEYVKRNWGWMPFNGGFYRYGK